jgi:membrane protein implicated in regulation of membrane protease activity
MGDLGRLLMLVGAVVFALGALLALAGRLPWLGRLPGDVVFERGPVTFYFPLATSLILSVVLTLLLWFYRR